MKQVIIAMTVIFLFTGCIKTNLDEIIVNTKSNPAPDYWLRFNHGASNLSYYQSSLNIPDAGEAAVYSIKSASLKLRIGQTEPVPGLQNRLYTIIDFPQLAKPEDVVGSYEFPEANSKISLTMTQIINGDTLKRTNPDFGKLEVKYDQLTKTLNGSLDKIIFKHPLDSADLLNGKFNHIPLEK